MRYQRVGSGAPRGCAAPTILADTPEQETRTVTVKSTIGVLVVVFVVFYAITSPDQAANIFHTAWHAVVNLAHGVGKFFDKLSS